MSEEKRKTANDAPTLAQNQLRERFLQVQRSAVS